jgi:hypothetical protein
MRSDDYELAALTAGVDLGVFVPGAPDPFTSSEAAPLVCAPPLIPSWDGTKCVQHYCGPGHEPMSFQDPSKSPHVCVPKKAAPAPIKCARPLIPSWDGTKCVQHYCGPGHEPMSFQDPSKSPHVCVPKKAPGPGPKPKTELEKAFPWLLVGLAGAAGAALLMSRRKAT